MDVLLSSYLQGLHTLKREVEKGGSDEQVVSILHIRLRENIEKMRIQGDTKDISADRMVILSTANEITERLLGVSFVDYCQAHTRTAWPPEQPSMPLASAESEMLKAALLSAFPSPGDLQQVVAFKLSENLAVIAGGNNYGEIVFNLIQWAEAQGRTADLIVGARQVNPGNPRLRTFEAQYRIRFSRTTVFIGSSHQDQDQKYLAELHTHLKHYVRSEAIKVWDDTMISPGAKWSKEIEHAVQAAKVAVLLISADFLASDWIASQQLPHLLKAAEQEGVKILCVILRPCDFEATALAQFKPVNPLSRPLSHMTRGKRDEVWTRVAQYVRDVL